MNNEKKVYQQEENKKYASLAVLTQLWKNCPIRWRSPRTVHDAEIHVRPYTDEIIVHCTATPQGRNFTMEDIRQMHLKRGWKDIGYHYVILRDGTVCEGRPEHLVGAHCEGHNERSLGLAYVGGTDTTGRLALDTRTIGQRDALRRLLCLLHARYPRAKVYGHREFAKKDCPCFNVHEEYGGIFGERR